MLFTRCVSGTRVVPRGQHKSVGGVDFIGYGASVDGYPHDYLTAACAVGLSAAELDEFLLRLDKAIRKAKGQRAAGEVVESNSVEAKGKRVETGVLSTIDPPNGSARQTGAESVRGVAVLAGLQGDAESANGVEVCEGVNGSAGEVVEAEDSEFEDWDGVD